MNATSQHRALEIAAGLTLVAGSVGTLIDHDGAAPARVSVVSSAITLGRTPWWARRAT